MTGPYKKTISRFLCSSHPILLNPFSVQNAPHPIPLTAPVQCYLESVPFSLSGHTAMQLTPQLLQPQLEHDPLHEQEEQEHGAISIERVRYRALGLLRVESTAVAFRCEF